MKPPVYATCRNARLDPRCARLSPSTGDSWQSRLRKASSRQASGGGPVMGLLRVLLRALFRGPSERRGYRAEPVRAARPHERIPVAVGPVRSSQPQPEGALVGRCWVIDGDTIEIGGTRIRLAGIDAPELDDPYGKNAKWTLVQLCKGAQIRAVFSGDLSHDRTVATCYLPDGRDLSAEMVKLGVAIDWPKFSRGKYRHLEPEWARNALWRCVARQEGRMPPAMPD